MSAGLCVIILLIACPVMDGSAFSGGLIWGLRNNFLSFLSIYHWLISVYSTEFQKKNWKCFIEMMHKEMIVEKKMMGGKEWN